MGFISLNCIFARTQGVATAMANIKYKYAYTDDNVLICIDDILSEERKSHRYFCISCGHELLPRALQSKKRTPHFYHKKGVEVVCSVETYLHKLAKKLIKSKFDSRRPFAIKYPVTIECENNSCELVEVKCSRKEDYELNLYDYYDTCTEEGPYGGFVADLLLTSSQKESRQPLFIEIYVKHRCDQKKIGSGIKIIEIYFKSEDSILKFIEKEIIDINDSQRDSRLSSDIKLYSFKRTIKKLLKCENFHLENFVSRSTSSSPLNVQSPPVKVERKDSFFFKQHEVNTHSIDIQQRSCFNCKNNNWFQEAYGKAACKYWRRFNLESLIDPDYALECSQFECKHLGKAISDNVIPQPELIKAICPEYAWQSKDSTPASFLCCPTQISDRAIEDYCDKLLIGDVYCEIPLDDGGKLCHKVIDKTCVDYNKAFFVISKNEDAYKKFALHKVYLLDDKFIHEKIGQYFDEQEARKNLASAQGLEWSGSYTIDDIFKF